MRRDSQIILVLAAALALVGAAGGCSGIGPASASDGLLPGMAQYGPETGKVAQSSPEDYTRQSREQQDRALVAPALGYQPKPEPSTFSKMSSAVAESSVVKAMTSVFHREPAAAPVPQKDEMSPGDPTSVFTDPPAPSPKLHVEFARAHEKQGNFAAAAERYRQALQIAPDNLDALLGLARLHDRQGDFAAATPLYEKALAAHPDSAPAANDLGLCYARQGQHDKAAVMLKRAIKIDPKRKLYRNNLATVLVEMGRVDEAYEQLAAAHPKAVAHYNLGFLLGQAGKRQAASEHFAAALAADPKLTAARQWLDLLGPEQPPTSPVPTAATPRVGQLPSTSRNQPTAAAPAPAAPVAADRFPARAQQAVAPAPVDEKPLPPDFDFDPPQPQFQSQPDPAKTTGVMTRAAPPSGAAEGPTRYQGRFGGPGSTQTPSSPMSDSATVVRPRETSEPAIAPDFAPAVNARHEGEVPPTPEALDGYNLEHLRSDAASSPDRPAYHPPSRY